MPHAGDISFSTSFDVSDRPALERGLSVEVFYQVDNEELFIGDHADAVIPRVNSDKILSTIDLPGTTLIVRAQSGLFEKLRLISITIQTERGQTINIENPNPVNWNNETAFEYMFPDIAQH